MQHLGLLFTLSLLAINLWGLMLVAGLYWRNRWFAMAVGPILAVTAVYAIECHHGLGRSLGWLGLLSTVLSVAVAAGSIFTWAPGRLGARTAALLREWRAEFAPRRLVGCFGVCAAVFLYAMSWRFIYPNIDGSSEKIADFSFICSYYTGGTIPVPDAWFYPYFSTQYYSFQHYAAALMGRVLLLEPGSAYNIAYCLLIALGGTAFAGAVCLVARKAWVRVLIITGFVVGGTGMTGIVHLTDKNALHRQRADGQGAARPVAQGLPGQVQDNGSGREAVPDGASRGDLLLCRLPGRLSCAAVGLLPAGPLCDGDAALEPHAAEPLSRDRGVHAHLDSPCEHLGPTAPGARHLHVAGGQLERMAAPGARRRRGGGDRLACGMGIPVGVHGRGLGL